MNIHRIRSALCLLALLATAWTAHALPIPLTIDDLPQPLVAKQSRSEAEADRVEALARFAAGNTAEQRQEYAKALRCYSRALRLDPRATAAADAVIPLAIHEHQYPLAAYAARTANLAEIELMTLHRLGVYLTQSGDFARAGELYEKALASRSGKKERAAEVLLRAEIARLYQLQGQYKKAADQCARVIYALEHPADFDLEDRVKQVILGEAGSSWQLFGECFLLADKLPEATAAFQKANQAAPNEALLRFNLARVAVRSGKPEEALAGLQPYFDKHLATEGAAPYEALAEALKKLGKEKELIGRLEKLRAADPDNVPLGYFLAARYEKQGPADKAEPLYAELVKKAPASTAYRCLVQTYAKGKQVERLLVILGDLVDKTGLLDASGAEAKTIAGDAELMRRLIETARRKLKDAPDKFTYSERLAMALLALEAKQYDTAREFFELALADQPKRANEVLLAWGVGLLLDERSAEAAKVFQRGIELVSKEKPSLASQLLSRVPGLKPDRPAVNSAAVFQFYLAGALAMADRVDDALAAASKAVELSKGSIRFASRRPWILYRAKRYDEALRAYSALVDKLEADDSFEARETLRQTRLQLSNLCVLMKRLPEAEEWLEQVLDEYPEDVGAANDLGYLWADQGKHLQRALAMILRAVAAEPDNGAYRDSLGWIYYRLGRYPEAVAELEKAAAPPAKAKPDTSPGKPPEKPSAKEPAEEQPDKRAARQAEEPDGTIFDHLGDAYLKAGRPDQARDAWRRAVQRFRKDKEEEKAKEVEGKLKEK